MTDAVEVSVVIPTRNGGARFREVLTALDAQEIEGGFELVVVDSSSTDGTAEAAAAAGAVVERISPADFNHGSYFPINSGRHRGVWSGCETCHVNPGNFRVFECTTCHEHSRGEMDDEHDDVPGYSYDSSSCYRCHPRGEAEED